jgi:hypothetical protein
MRRIDRAVMRMMRLAGIPTVGLGLLLFSATVAVRAAEPAQQTFASPEQAAAALAEAWGQDDKAALMKIFGSGGAKLISSGDPVADAEAKQRLAAEYNLAHRIENESDVKAVLSIGKDDFPYPIPLLKQDSAWYFDTKAGEQEILDRRIGHNELNAIDVCHAYVEAQRAYAAQYSSGNGPAEYAQRLHSSVGKHDGLYWAAETTADESPFGPLVASAEAAGYSAYAAGMRTPYHGYYFRILKQQGANAPGGAKDYVVNGHMTGGFAMIAFPAKYGDSGIMTFIVDQTGIVFEQNLGPGTDAAARQISTYDPDDSWQPTRP